MPHRPSIPTISEESQSIITEGRIGKYPDVLNADKMARFYLKEARDINIEGTINFVRKFLQLFR